MQRVGEGRDVGVVDRLRQPADRRRVEPAALAAPPSPASSAASRAANTAPSTAVPSEPPIERNSVEPDVATPSMS